MPRSLRLSVMVAGVLALTSAVHPVASASSPRASAVQSTDVAAPSPAADATGPVTKHADLAYGSVVPGNLLDLYVPDVPGDATFPLLIWHSGSGFFANEVKDFGDDVAVVREFTSRGYAVASINIRSSEDARFPAQGFDVRAAVRYLRENAATYGIDPDRIAFMGDSSGGWAAAFAAATSDTLALTGENGVDGTSSGVQVAVAFFPPTDFLSIDAFAEANGLPMDVDAYPHDGPTSPEGLLVQCPDEGPSDGPPRSGSLMSIQACPDETEKADPASYVDGAEIPIWLLHGLADPLLPFNQSQLLYDATTAAGNEARLTLVPGAGHAVDEIIDAPASTTWTTDRGGQATAEGPGPSWDEIERFIDAHLGPAPDREMAAAMLQSVIGSEVDRGATFRRVEAEIDAIFRDERYSGLLAGLRDERPLLSYGPDVTRATRRSILAGIDSCRRPDDIDVGRHERCSGMVDALIGYASQFPRLADRPEAALNRAFERAAILLRSAAVNDGLSARSLDRHSRSTAEFWAGTVHGWVGFGASPAGLYSWPVRPRAHGWMHKVPGRSADGAPNSVELTFYGGELRGPAANVLSEIRPIDVEGTTVTIRLDWFPDTEPALLAEARSVVDSIAIQPTDSGHRLVFRLEEGWDKG